MNNTFNIKRFGLTMRKDFIENGKRYLFLFVTLLGLITVAITFMTWEYYLNVEASKTIEPSFFLFHNKNLLTFLSFTFLAAGIWFASTFTAPMNSKLKRITYLISPASNLEKYLTRWIITTMGFIVAFFAAMWIADAIRVALCSMRYPEIEIKFLDLSKLYYPDKIFINSDSMVPKGVFQFFLSLYFLFQSIFLLGSTYWEKASFIKTFTFGAVITAAFILICRWTILLFYGSLDGYGNVMSSFEINHTISEEQAVTIAAIVLAVFTLTFWVLAYFRMKESEIIKRF